MQIFKNFPAEHDPGPPKSRFCCLSFLELTLPEKIALEKSDEIWCPLPKKFLNAPLT